MNIPFSHHRDLALLNLVGWSLFRLILKARNRSRAAAAEFRKTDRQHDDRDAPLGYETAWDGGIPGPGSGNRIRS